MANQKATMVVAGAGVVVLAVTLSRKAKAASKVTSLEPALAPIPVSAPSRVDTKLGEHFMLSEFLVSSTFPDLKDYTPTAKELANAKNLVDQILEPLREKYGPIQITSGGRPESVARAHGTTWHDALAKQGLAPAEHSDHADFSGVDFVPTAVTDASKLIDLVDFLKHNDSVRQVIPYFKSTPDGGKALQHIHVGLITDTGARIPEPSFYFAMLDNKRVVA